MSLENDNMANENRANDDVPSGDVMSSDLAVSEDIERLIVRRLDGELTDEQSLVLDRELLRCPGARAMFDAYLRIDALAGAAIRATVNSDEPPAPVAIETGARRGFADESIRFDRGRTARAHRWMWVASAVAACLAMAMFWHTPPERTGGDAGFAGRTTAPVAGGKNHAPIPWVGSPGGDVGVFNAADITPRPVDRQTDRSYYIVPNKSDGRIYLLSVDRIRELEQPENAADGSRRWDPI